MYGCELNHKEEEKLLSPIRLCDPMDCDLPDSSEQEYWSGLLLPSPEDLPELGIKPRYPALQADTLTSEPQGKPKES